MKKLLCYRPYLGAFKESMSKMRRFPNMDKLISKVCREQNGATKWKVEWYCYDSRLKADTFLVLLDGKAVGLCWYDLKEIKATLADYRMVLRKEQERHEKAF